MNLVSLVKIFSEYPSAKGQVEMTELVFGRGPKSHGHGCQATGGVGQGLACCCMRQGLASMILSKEITVSCLAQEVESSDPPLSLVCQYVLPPDDLNQIYVAK